MWSPVFAFQSGGDTMQGPLLVHPTLQTGWQFAEGVRARLLETIRPLTSGQWLFRRQDNSWSVAEIVEHLLRAEIGTSKMVRKLIRGDYLAQDFPVGATLYTRDLDGYPYGRLQAPPDLAPGPPADRAELERRLAVAHARLQTELGRFRGNDPEALRSPDPATGVWYTLGGWVKLQAWHELHHVAQIGAMLAAPGFPLDGPF